MQLLSHDLGLYKEILNFLIVLIGSCLTCLLGYCLINFNGRTVIKLFNCILKMVSPKPNINREYGESEIVLAGIAPLALSILIQSSFNVCTNSIKVFLTTEIVIVILAIIVSNLSPRQNLLSIKYFISHFIKHKNILIVSGIWCIIFSIWTNLYWHNSGFNPIDRLMINTNPDMWAYVKRFAGLTTENLSFEGASACASFLESPKKLSSFIGAIIISLWHDPSLGIILFQGILGLGIFLCLFIDWIKIKPESNGISWPIKAIGLSWAIASPQIFWLLVSSYLSNTLFIIILCLGLRAIRRIAINGNFGQAQSQIVLGLLIINIISFYPAFLPLALTVCLLTGIIYTQNSFKTKIIIILKILTFTSLIILVLYLFFNAQLLNQEVSVSLNPKLRHGTNFVPLNPWSLLQEKPKPMPVRKDFGVWFNIILGLIFSGFVLQKLWHILRNKNNKNELSLVQIKDLKAGFLGIVLYALYLLAYIPLEHTYRLGKIAISVFWPLAIFALLPLFKWLYFKVKASHKGWLKPILIIFLISHLILHIDMSLRQKPRPSGNFYLSLNDSFNQKDSLTIVGCPEAHISQYYERMVGLRLAYRYPNMRINVVKSKENILDAEATNIIEGKTIYDRENKLNICSY